MSGLRVVTWNVRNARGLDQRVDLDRVVRVLEPLEADIIALQELDVGRARTGRVDQPAVIAARLSMSATFCGAVEDEDGGRYGHALLTREPPSRADVRTLPRVPLREPRGMIDLDVPTPAGRVRAMSVHLGLLELERLRQVHPVATAVRNADTPVVLMGDFNASAWMPSMRVMLRALDDATPKRDRANTWHARWPVRRLDYVLVRGFDGAGSRTLREGPALVASDHVPLVAQLTARGGVRLRR